MPGKVKLTKSMHDALFMMKRVYGTSSVKFQTGEALRKRGFAARHTLYVSKAIYAEQNCITRQGGTPRQWHEWYITPAGCAHLSSGRTGE